MRPACTGLRSLRRWSLALALLWGAAACAAVTVIHAGHLIAEPGAPALERQSLLVENGRIVSVRPGFVDGARVVDLSNAWVLPGLIDMHTHVTMRMDINGSDPTADFMPGYLGRPAARVLASVARAQAVLRNGFTTIRNLGDPASVTYDLRDAIEAGVVDGPRIIGSEPQFGVAGGDYEGFVFGERADLEPLFRSRGTCAGAVDCERAVREEIRRGAGVIKLRLSAQTLIDPASGPMETRAELEAIVATAHRLHRRVAAHSVGTPAANQLAIEAGVDTIEHGPVDDANIAAMVKRHTAYTPTMLAAKIVSENAKLGAPPDYYARVVASVAAARRAGLSILFGSDLPVMPSERVAEEFVLLRQAGLTASEVLRSATVNAAAALGLADRIGTLAAGKAADIVAVAADPMADVGVLARVGFVMKGGKVIRNDFAAGSAAGH